MSHVFVVDTTKKPLAPVHPGEARCLLTQGKAAVLKRFPFTIILKEEVHDQQVQPLRIKLDPGSRTTGIAIINDCSGQVVFAAELTHRGHKISVHAHPAQNALGRCGVCGQKYPSGGAGARCGSLVDHSHRSWVSADVFDG